MAIRYAVASGNWSSPSTWDGGMALPGVLDTVYANGKNITIDQNIYVQGLYHSAQGSAIAGGTFIMDRSVSMVCNVFSSQASTNILDIVANSPETCTIIGNLYWASSGYGYTKSGTCTLNITGNVYGQSTYTTGTGFRIKALGSVTITGNVYGSAVCYNASTIGVSIGTLNVIGNIMAPTWANPYGNTNTVSISSGYLNISGNVYAGDNGAYDPSCGPFGVYATSGVIDLNGYAYASRTTPAIVVTLGNGKVVIHKSIVNTEGVMAICAPRIVIDHNNEITWKYQDTTNADRYMCTAGVSLGNPNSSDVRSSVHFGPNNELTGTLNVPPVNSVVAGVPVDNTVGTFAFTSELITRLQNCATVESVGEQLVALE